MARPALPSSPSPAVSPPSPLAHHSLLDAFPVSNLHLINLWILKIIAFVWFCSLLQKRLDFWNLEFLFLRVCVSALSPELKSTLDKVVKSHKVILFMKGTKDFPQCGFSSTVVQILNSLNVPFETLNILENEILRQGLKEYSNWPTFPQLYIDGEFFGGCDITVGIAPCPCVLLDFIGLSSYFVFLLRKLPFGLKVAVLIIVEFWDIFISLWKNTLRICFL